MKILAALGAVLLLPPFANAALVSWEFDDKEVFSPFQETDFSDQIDGELLWEADGSNFDLVGASLAGDEFAFNMHDGTGSVDLYYEEGFLDAWRGGAEATGEISNWRGDEANIQASVELLLESFPTSENSDPIKDDIDWVENFGLFRFNADGVDSTLALNSGPDRITVHSEVPEPATLGLLVTGLALLGLRRRII